MGLDYWFSLPLPFRLRANINNAFSSMRAAGMQADAPAYMAGHSMGGSIGQDVALEFFERGELQGLIALASYLNVKYFPPVSTDGFSYPMPTLTVGAEMNYGAGRLSRIAAAAYRQRQNNVSGLDYPVVLIEGMNHMQFATGYEKEDLMPERGDEVLQTEVARVSVDYIKQQLGLGRGSIVAVEQNRTRNFLTPVERAFEYEGSPNYDVTNQKGVPNNDCPRGVCPTFSPWSVYAQSYILGAEVLAAGVQVVDNYADLNPWGWGEREDRKPFFTADKRTAMSYVQGSGTESEFNNDVAKPVAPLELLGKFSSRQAGKLAILGQTVGRDPDFCRELNNESYAWALNTVSKQARKRFETYGVPMTFGATEYKPMGPLWVSSELKYDEKEQSLELVSAGIFTEPGDRTSRGNHYCKLLSPARAMEYVLLDGLKRKLFRKWCGLRECA